MLCRCCSRSCESKKTQQGIFNHRECARSSATTKKKAGVLLLALSLSLSLALSLLNTPSPHRWNAPSSTAPSFALASSYCGLVSFGRAFANNDRNVTTTLTIARTVLIVLYDLYCMTRLYDRNVNPNPNCIAPHRFAPLALPSGGAWIERATHRMRSRAV